ncbi:MFS transporter [Salimicrobium sp. PL1-032A]|uniref:MFS transporter n=1 Tax=Salimicrobium sp. PL1-032A TaxID=3095364 RepID=UPI003260D154
MCKHFCEPHRLLFAQMSRELIPQLIPDLIELGLLLFPLISETDDFGVGITIHNVQEEKPQQQKTVMPVLVAALLAMTMFFIAFITLPFYLADNFGLASAETGYFMAMISLIAVLSASMMPKMVQHFTDYRTLITGFTLFTLGFTLLSLGQGFFAVALTAGVVIGVGFGFTIPLANHMVVEKSTVSSRGKNLARFSSFTFAGQFLSSLVEGVSTNLIALYFIAIVSGVLIIAGYSVWLARSRTDNETEREEYSQTAE